ncbi:hypothetical protein TNCT_639291 [Trichonephila clavata]|uniref:Uncharacterized protein n=1 Tax=Trichonephila clavata TaxID=2740835 RepID=A0A8X6HNZ8_TRICU|nr:hypothetical protein TNCT_639291 [Trichonephila clavata]
MSVWEYRGDGTGKPEVNRSPVHVEVEWAGKPGTEQQKGALTLRGTRALRVAFWIRRSVRNTRLCDRLLKDLPCLAQTSDLSGSAHEKCHPVSTLDKRSCHGRASETKSQPGPFSYLLIHRQVLDVIVKAAGQLTFSKYAFYTCFYLLAWNFQR